jgi:hypothetical protein
MSLFNRIRNAAEKRTDTELDGVPPTWNTPVPFDPHLLTQLLARHDELDARLAALRPMLASHPALAESVVRECADYLHELRHTEALRLYPVIARSLSPDPVARRLFWQSRLVMLGLARRVMRRFEDLGRAVRAGKGSEADLAHVVNGLAEYRRRNEATMYPLYTAVGEHGARQRNRVA